MVEDLITLSRVVNTPFGNKFIFRDQDLIEIIKNGCGHEVANIVEYIFDTLSEEQVYEKERAHTDADSLEASCEEYRDMLLDVQEFIDQILKNMDEHPRLKKDTIYNELARIPKKINTIL